MMNPFSTHLRQYIYSTQKYPSHMNRTLFRADSGISITILENGKASILNPALPNPLISSPAAQKPPQREARGRHQAKAPPFLHPTPPGLHPPFPTISSPPLLIPSRTPLAPHFITPFPTPPPIPLSPTPAPIHHHHLSSLSSSSPHTPTPPHPHAPLSPLPPLLTHRPPPQQTKHQQTHPRPSTSSIPSFRTTFPYRSHHRSLFMKLADMSQHVGIVIGVEAVHGVGACFLFVLVEGNGGEGVMALSCHGTPDGV